MSRESPRLFEHSSVSSDEHSAMSGRKGGIGYGCRAGEGVVMPGPGMDHLRELPRADTKVDGLRSKAVQTKGGGVEGHSTVSSAQRGNPDHHLYVLVQEVAVQVSTIN